MRAGQNAALQMDHGGRIQQPRGGSVSCDVKAYVSCREFVGIPTRVRSMNVYCANQGGTADQISYVRFVPDRMFLSCQGLFVSEVPDGRGIARISANVSIRRKP